MEGLYKEPLFHAHHRPFPLSAYISGLSTPEDVYLAGPERYDKDAKEIYKKRKELCASYGLQAFTPADWAEGVEKMDTDCPYTAAANQFDSWQQHVRNCDAIIADLNDYRGYEYIIYIDLLLFL